MGVGGQMISIHPEELTFGLELEKPSYCNLKVINNTEQHVAFKVKTTAPKKYFVRPNTSVVQPWDSCTIVVTLQPQKEYPPDIQCKDKFLIQSAKVPPISDMDEIPLDTFSKEDGKVIDEHKLKVVYTSPAQSDHGNLEGESGLASAASGRRGSDMMNNSGIEETQALQRLKEERNATLKQNHQFQRELEILKKRRSHKGDAGFSLAFTAFAGLIGVLVGFILNLTLSTPSSG